MSDELNFGYRSNGQVCQCGKHHGIGEFSPERRAAIAARMRDKLPSVMSGPMAEYLKSWESVHGHVQYRIDVIGTNSGEFIKANKGQTLMGPVYINSHIYSGRA